MDAKPKNETTHSYILQVIELLPPETIERIGEIVWGGLERERVMRVWG